MKSTWDENCKCYFAIYNNGKQVKYEGPSLINYFSYGDNSLKIHDIVKSMNLDEKLSDDISEIQCNTGKIQTNLRMNYQFSLPSIFKKDDYITDKTLKSTLSLYL